MKTQAERIVEICGGEEKLAELAGVHVTTVYRWTWPKKRGGYIPARHYTRILEEARKRGIPLTPEDFMVAPSPISSGSALCLAP